MKKWNLAIFIFGILLFIQPLMSQTWEVAKRLTWNSSWSEFPAIAADSVNHLHVVWQDSTPGNQEIFYKRSTDSGTSWSTMRLTYTSGDSWDPSIAVDSDDNLFVAWYDGTHGNDEIFYAKSTDGGSSWKTKRLTWNSGDSWWPSIALDPEDRIHVVWSDNSFAYYEIYHKMSTDGGASWTQKRLTYSPGHSYVPYISVDSYSRLHVVWMDGISPGNSEIFYKISTDTGTNWSTKRLTWTSDVSSTPTIAVGSNGHIHVTWFDDTPGNSEIFYKTSTDGGMSWSAKRLTWNSGGSQESVVSVDKNDYIHVVWRDESPVNAEIYHKRSTDGGSSWTTQRLTWNSGNSYSPSIAVDSNNHLHVVWFDYTPGISEIYYRKGIQ
jgi:hypothetical protein